MKQTGASDEKVEQAARYLRHDYGYAAVGAYQVVTDVIGIAVSRDERIITLDDLKALYVIADVSVNVDNKTDELLLQRVADLIVGEDAP